MVKLIEVKNKRDLNRFIEFPYKLYRKHPYWVPPLRFDERNTLLRSKNPSFEYCDARYWLAVENGTVLGRIAAILNKKSIEKWGKKYLRFGWFDLVNRFDVAEALIGAVEDWAHQLDLTAVHGPLGFTDLDPEGLLIEGFEERGTLPMIYNYPYYPDLLEQLGYAKDVDWLQFEIPVPDAIGEKFTRMRDIVLTRNKLHIAEFRNRKDVISYGERVFEALNKAYEKLYGVVELTDKQVQTYIRQ
ncbi:MAG: hypothetical protein ACP5IA_12810 [Sediminispirochaetaceae bacterium]